MKTAIAGRHVGFEDLDGFAPALTSAAYGDERARKADDVAGAWLDRPEY